MKKQEFLDILTRKLTGQFTSTEVKDNIQYYDGYISGEVYKGKSEEQVIQEIGGPHIVAKTLINAKNMAGQSNSSKTHKSYSQDIHRQAGEKTGQRKGFHVNHDNNGWDVRYGKVKLNTWYFKLILAILVILLIIGVLSAVGFMLRVLIPIIVPVLVIFFIFNLVSNRRYR